MGRVAVVPIRTRRSLFREMIRQFCEADALRPARTIGKVLHTSLTGCPGRKAYCKPNTKRNIVCGERLGFEFVLARVGLWTRRKRL
jgi:hypothetical protein